MNYRRGLERIEKALMVWGFLVSIISIINFFISWLHDPDPATQPTVVYFSISAVVAWGPFLLFKLLFWIGDGFIDDDNDN